MKLKKWSYFAMAAALTVSAFALSACGGEKPEPKPAKQQGLTPTSSYRMPIDDGGRTTDVSVHDPSVFYDENSKTYYAFGTHYAVASSKDLVTWEQYSSDNEWNKLYDAADPVTYAAGIQWPKALDETLQLVDPAENGGDTIGTTWAPDVNYHDGKYYMYYSITKKFGSSESVIGRVESDRVTGPYSGNKIILSSVGRTGNHVNCIDPELFTDKEGKLWMVYGSHFAGVYIKELNNSGADWGLPKEEGDGKLLWKGGARVVEGPFVFYNDLTDYYYLMTSYGDLTSTYNMRIARSKNPDGPYVDVTGADMATTNDNGTLHGNKVAGSYQFADAEGAAYAALGHNSVVKDTGGKYFVVYHTRRQTGTTVQAPHTLYVSQLFFNEEGWPVMSPLPYVGETFGKIAEEDAAGEYDIVVHSTGTTTDIAQSVKYTLAEDGTVKNGSAEAGTWALSEDFYITITLNDVEYKGVIVPGWNSYPSSKRQTAAFAITAISKLSDQGGSLWGIGAREDA